MATRFTVITHPDRALKRLINKLVNGERDVSDADRNLLLKFDDRMALLKSKSPSQRREKLLRHCAIIAEQVGGLAGALHDGEAAEEMVRWINRTYDNEETNKDYRTALRMFGKRVAEVDDEVATNDDDVPVSLAWIPTTTSE